MDVTSPIEEHLQTKHGGRRTGHPYGETWNKDPEIFHFTEGDKGCNHLSLIL